ncbi:hypothetical protein KCU87_g365, partial [Aureobasidium melanogenum]
MVEGGRLALEHGKEAIQRLWSDGTLRNWTTLTLTGDADLYTGEAALSTGEGERDLTHNIGTARSHGASRSVVSFSSCDGSRGSLGMGLVALLITGERPGRPVCGVSGVWLVYALSAILCPSSSYDLCYSLATEGSMRGRGFLFGLEGGLLELCLTGGNVIGCFSVEGDVAGDAIGDLGFCGACSSFCEGVHTCSPIAEIWISAPQSEHLIDGRMLNGRAVSMVAHNVDSRDEFLKMNAIRVDLLRVNPIAAGTFRSSINSSRKQCSPWRLLQRSRRHAVVIKCLDPPSIQGHHHPVARQTPQVPVKTICSTRSLDSSRSLSAVGGLIKGDEHSRLGQSTQGSRMAVSLIGCESTRQSHPSMSRSNCEFASPLSTDDRIVSDAALYHYRADPCDD